METAAAHFRPPPDFPQRVKALRHRLGLSQQQLAELFAVSSAAVALWEKGGLYPSQHDWQRIALLARLSVFRQAFPLVALEQGLHATRAEWQPLLDWSLLRYDPLEKAYHLHSLTRRYAENLLAVQDRQHTQEQVATCISPMPTTTAMI